MNKQQQCAYCDATEMLTVIGPGRYACPAHLKSVLQISCICMVCDQPFENGQHECPIKLTELERELIGVMAIVLFCDHFCCGMTDILCNTKQLLLALERHDLKLVSTVAVGDVPKNAND